MTDEEQKAIHRLGTNHGINYWHDAGYFDVPGQVMRDLVAAGYARMRKRSASSPVEYQGTWAAFLAKRGVA